jgi:hypothetical protein
MLFLVVTANAGTHTPCLLNFCTQGGRLRSNQCRWLWVPCVRKDDDKSRAYLILRHREPTGRANARPMTGSAKRSRIALQLDGFRLRVRTLRRTPGAITCDASDGVARFRSSQDVTPHSRDANLRPGVAKHLRPKSEGAGNAGRSMRPQPCVQDGKARKHSHHGHTGLTRHSTREWFYGFLRALPGDRACCLRHRRDAKASSPT